MTRKDRGRICFVWVFACVVGKNLKTPNLSPMAYDAITLDGTGGLGSLVYIYGVYTFHEAVSGGLFHLISIGAYYVCVKGLQ